MGVRHKREPGWQNPWLGAFSQFVEAMPTATPRARVGSRKPALGGESGAFASFFGSGSSSSSGVTPPVSTPSGKANSLELKNHTVKARVAPDRNGQSRTQLQLRSKSGVMSLTLELAASAEAAVISATKEVPAIFAAIVELLLSERKGKKGQLQDQHAWRELCATLGCPLLSPLFDATTVTRKSPPKPATSSLTPMKCAISPVRYSYDACSSARAGGSLCTALGMVHTPVQPTAEDLAEEARLNQLRRDNYHTLPAEEQLIMQFEALASAGADFNAPLKDELTPLVVAMQMRSSAAVRFCLKHGADAALVTGGRSPLLVACQQGLSELLYLLIQHGADVVRGALTLTLTLSRSCSTCSSSMARTWCVAR
jgi:hypothetical protein